MFKNYSRTNGVGFRTPNRDKGGVAMKRSRVGLVTMLLFLTLGRSETLVAQCARCVSPPFAPSYCEWGPFAGGGYTACEGFYGGCLVAGDCTHTFVPFTPDGIARVLAGGQKVPSTISVSDGDVTILRACRGVIVDARFSAHAAFNARRSARRLVV